MNGNDRSIVTFAGLSHAIVHTYELSIPILIVIWLSEFSTTTATLGVVSAVGYALFGIGALPGGILADRFGSQSLIVVCLAGMAASFLVLSVATGVAVIAVALCLWGVAASVYHPAGLALISTGVEDRGTGFAYHGMAGNVGIAIGPLVTAVLLLAFDWRTVVRLLTVPSILAIGLAVTADVDERAAVSADGGDDAGSEGLSLAAIVADSKRLFTVGFTVVMAVVVMNGLFYRGVLTFLPDVLGEFVPSLAEVISGIDADSPLAQELDASSYVYAGLLLVGIGGQYVGGKLTDRRSPTALLAVTFGALAVIAPLFVPAAELGVGALLAASAVLGFFLFALQPLYQATIAEYTPPDGRGLSYGFTYLASFGVGATGAAIAGYLLTVVGVSGTFLALTVFPVVGSGLSLLLARSIRP